MRKPNFDMTVFKDRRGRLNHLAEGSAIILASHSEYIRNHDVHHNYRQDSNLFYLTGFEEPESVLIFRPGMTPETTLFVRKKDVTRETWDGFRYGPDLTKELFCVDEAYVIDDFHSKAVDLLKDVEKVYYNQYQNHWFDEKFQKLLLEVKSKKGRNGKGLLPVYDSYPLIGEMRLRKSVQEVEILSEACQISAEAHVSLMRATRPGMSERELHGLFIYEIMKRGCAREGYGGIFAGGANACTLHYVFNDEVLNDGDLVLVDAGGEYQYYSGDITRVWPVNGKFNDVQARLYNKLLALQKEMVAMIKPGLIIKDHMDQAISGLVDIMIDEKLLSGSKEQLIEEGAFRKYYPHGLGHFLGMDVHDAGAYLVNGESRPLEPGMALTVEPGIYIPADDDTAPKELRGIGLRIEDDVLVTESGHEVMTTSVPKEISEIESLMS